MPITNVVWAIGILAGFRHKVSKLSYSIETRSRNEFMATIFYPLTCLT